MASASGGILAAALISPRGILAADYGPHVLPTRLSRHARTPLSTLPFRPQPTPRRRPRASHVRFQSKGGSSPNARSPAEDPLAVAHPTPPDCLNPARPP